MELKLVTNTGEQSSDSVSLSDATFTKEYNEALIHQVVNAYLAGARAGTRGHKNRSAVRGGGAKPWRQKGTGRARAGTIRSPIWRTGGKTFAIVGGQDFSQKVNKKMYRGAMCSILSELIRQERLVAVSDFAVEAPKTKLLNEKLSGMGLDGKVLIVTAAEDASLVLASRNMKNVDVVEAKRIDPVSLVGFDKVVVTADAIKQVEEMFA